MEPNKTNSSVQKMRISDEDKSLIRATFKDRDDLLMATRNLLFGFELTDTEKVLLKAYESEAVRKLMRKMLLPELQKDIPIGQSIDLWMTVQLVDKDDDKVVKTLQIRKRLIELIETALKMLSNEAETIMSLEVDDNTTDIDLVARNTYITHIEQQLVQISVLAESKELTAEEMVEKIKKDSSK